METRVDLVERLRFTANAGVPDFTNSKLLDEAADEIERLRAGHARLCDKLGERCDEIGRLRLALRINGLRWGHTHKEIDALIADQDTKP